MFLHKPSNQKPLIVVASNDDTIRELIAKVLTHNGYDILEASTSRKVMETFKKFKPDLLILGTILADLDGFETCRLLKQQFGDNVPVILLTMPEDDESKEKGLQSGCNEFLTLPINSAELLTRVNNLLKISRLSRQLSLQMESPEKTYSTMIEKIEDEYEKKEFKILIIEDSPFNQLLLKTYLKKDNYNISTVSEGGKALEMLVTQSFDLVLLDIYLPDINGIEVLKRIRKLDKTKYTPVILITASDDPDTKIKGIEAGANDYLIKPISRHELKARVKSLLKSHQLQNYLFTNYAQVVEKAIKDGMTGLYNNSYLKQFLAAEIEYSIKMNKPLSLLMMDLDDFKDYNDTNGHPIGDKALQEVASIILKNIRNSDLPARYGGEEFAVVLPGTSSQEAVKVAQRIRQEIEAHVFEHQDKTKRKNLTISIGVAQLSKEMDVMSFLQRADSALYQAKRKGKNTVVRI